MTPEEAQIRLVKYKLLGHLWCVNCRFHAYWGACMRNRLTNRAIKVDPVNDRCGYYDDPRTSTDPAN